MFRVLAKKADAFKHISGRRLRKSQVALLTKVLEANFIPATFPLEIDGTVYKKEIILLKVTNSLNEEYVELNMPAVDSDGVLSYRSLEFGMKAYNEGYWTVTFEDYHFSAYLYNTQLKETKGMRVDGRLAGVSIVGKIQLLLSMMKKLEFFFTFSVEYSPAIILDVICQALSVCKNNIYDFTISIGKTTILQMIKSEMQVAVLQKKDCRVKISNDGMAKYCEKRFEFIQNQSQQQNRVIFDESFESDLDTDKLLKKIETAKKEICNLLQEVAQYNNDLGTVIKI